MQDTPAPDLTRADRDSLRDTLIAGQAQADDQIAALTRNFEAIVEAAELTGTDDEHDPEGTTIAFERAQVTALLNQAKADREAMEDAVQRLDDGTFGICETCEQPIGAARLEAIPSATKCIDCA